MDRLSTRKAAWQMVGAAFIVPVVLLSLRGLVDTLAGTWQVSGYYIQAGYWGPTCLLFAACLISIASIAIRRSLLRGLGQSVLLLAAHVAGIALMLVVSEGDLIWSRACVRPTDIVYSETRDTYYILDDQPGLSYEDNCRFFSTTGTLWNPVWHAEFGRLDSSGYVEHDEREVRLVLSQDEQLLVVERSGHYSDAVLIDSGEHITEYITRCPTAVTYNRRLRERTKRITSLLAEHGGGK